MLKRERKALVACRIGHSRTLGQSESQLLLPARHLSFHGGNLSYLSPTACCTPALQATTLKSPGWSHSLVLPWTEQSRFRLLCSGQTEATISTKQRGACKNSPLHISHTPSQKHQHLAGLWHICTAGANQVLTHPAVTGNAKWGADGWAGSRSSNQS